MTITNQEYVWQKCLSIKQPYVERIFSGEKIIEYRPQRSPFRGKFLIYGPKTTNKKQLSPSEDIDKLKEETGAIVGFAEVYGMDKYPDGIYGYKLRNAKKLKNQFLILPEGKLSFTN